MSTKQKFTDLLAELSGEERAKIEEAVTTLVDEVETSTRAEVQAEHEATAEKMARLIEQRDENLNRAQEAEQKACEALAERDELIETAREEGRLEVRVQLESLQNEYDELENRVTERLEAKYNNDLAVRTRKISRFLDAHLGDVAEALREELAKDPMVVRESAAFRRIADLVGETAKNGDGTVLDHPDFQKLQSESIALRAEIQTLQGRNTRLSEEVSMLRETETQTEAKSVQQSSPDTNDANPNSGDQQPPREENVPGATPPKHEPEPTASRDVPNTDDNRPMRPTPEGGANINGQNGTDVSESVSGVIDNNATEQKETPAPRTNRASELLREVFDARKAKTQLVQETSAPAQGGWADAGVGNLQESRSTRVERASNVTGKGELFIEDDILSETATEPKKAPGLDKIVPGTDSPLSEVLKLAGVHTEEN